MAVERATERKHRSRPAGRPGRSAFAMWLGVCAGLCGLALAVALAGAGVRPARGQEASPQANPANQQGRAGQSADPKAPAQSPPQGTPGSEAVPGDPDATMIADPDAPDPASAPPGGNVQAGGDARAAQGPQSGHAPGSGSAVAGGAGATPAASPVPAVRPRPARPLSAEEQRKQQVADECADLLKMATDLKSEVDKTTKDELSIAVVRKAGQIEQYARKLRSAPGMTASRGAADKPRGDPPAKPQIGEQTKQ